jgi:predicted DCC family thiol-disulfide oxidoreductase YuxK
MRMLRRHDTREQIRFSDISEADFDGAGTGLSRETLMRKLHGRLPDGRIIEGVEVFRRLYAAVGLGRLVRVSRLPGIAQLLDAAYALFARNRLRLTGRCEDGVCALPTSISSFD